MTLQETKEIILKWIASCESSEQLDILVDVRSSHLYNRFVKEADNRTIIELNEAMIELEAAILKKRLSIVTPPLSAPILDAYLEDDNFKEVIN